MIATIILYFWFLSSGRVLAAGPELYPAIDNFLEMTHTNYKWAPLYDQIDPAQFWWDSDYQNPLDGYLDLWIQQLGSKVDDHLSDPDRVPLDPEAINSIPRLVFLLRYSNLRFLNYYMTAWGKPAGGEASPLEVINIKYVNNVAAGYHREKEDQKARELGYMRFMVNVAILFAQNQSRLQVRVAHMAHARVVRYMDMITRVYRDMARLMKAYTHQPYYEDIQILADEIDKLYEWGFRTYLTHDIQKVARDVVNYVLAVILMYGDSANPSPKHLSDLILITANRELRNFLIVSGEKLDATTQEYWQRLMDILRPIFGNISHRLEREGGNQWVPLLWQKFNKLRDMGLVR
jgi:hypothetical protein